VPTFKAAYLIHGDDHGRIAERRARLRAVAEAESGTAGVEVFEEDASTPELVANALNAMTFAVGRRFVIADGVERWKDGDVGPVLDALKAIDPDTLTVAFFAREDGRVKAPAALAKAVTAAGGAIATESTVKGRDLPRWVTQHARELGLSVDNQAARALIARVGDRQQRLLRELEKIALELGSGAEVDTEAVEALTAGTSERARWQLGDAVVAGDRRTAMRLLVELRGQGERVPALLWAMAGRVREVHAVAAALERGEQPEAPPRMPPWKFRAVVEQARQQDAATLARMVELLADLELETRGGAGAVLSEDTAAVRVVQAIGSR
jgi:DNA polymerase-3 subunit delta